MKIVTVDKSISTYAADSALATVAEYFPAAHGEHVEFDVAPTAAENLPISHDVHVEADPAPTAFECLLGVLHLTDRARLRELLDFALPREVEE